MQRLLTTIRTTEGQRPARLLPALLLLATHASSSGARRESSIEVETIVQERVGTTVRLGRGESAGKSASPDRPLEVEEAVDTALRHNASLAAKLEEIGIGEADLAQAGLLSNPELHYQLRLPTNVETEYDGREFGISQNLIDVLARPLKKRMVALQFEQSKLRIGHEIMTLGTEVKETFYGLQAALQHLELQHTLVGSLKTTLDLAVRQHQAGNIRDLDLARHRIAYHEGAQELVKEEAKAEVARQHLALLMGVQDQEDWRIAPGLPDLPDEEPELSAIEELALESRWDLAATRREPAVLVDALRISRLNKWSGLSIGIDSERDFDGSLGVGPAVEVALPIFDTRHPANDRIKAQRRQSQRLIVALEQQIRFEVRSSWAKLMAARRRAETYRATLLPLKRKQVDELLLQYNYMLEGVYELILAKREELETRRSWIDALEEYWTQHAVLERAAGGRLPAPRRPAHREAEGEKR